VNLVWSPVSILGVDHGGDKEERATHDAWACLALSPVDLSLVNNAVPPGPGCSLQLVGQSCHSWAPHASLTSWCISTQSENIATNTHQPPSKHGSSHHEHLNKKFLSRGSFRILSTISERY
jgi:hypothetical protein